MQPRLAIIATHPIQYHAPLFRELARRDNVDGRVFYGWTGAARGRAPDPGFDRDIQWDVPLLEGYAFEFLPNRARDPGTHHFGGLDTPDLARRVLAWEPHAVLVFGWAWKSHLQGLRELHGRVPVLFRGDSTLLGERRLPKRWVRRAWLTWVYRHVDVALYTGTHNRAYFLAHGLRSEQLEWAPHAVDHAHFSDTAQERAAQARAWRHRLGIPDDAVTILYAGKLEPDKAPEVLLDAFLTLAPSNAHLILAGSGPLERELRSAAGMHQNVHFVGFQNQSRMPTVYRLGDVFVLPSRSETWGLAVNEAMTCGLPVIASARVGCAPDLVHNGENGIVVATEDVPALQAALATLVTDTALRQRMGDASRALIADWSMDVLARRIEESVAIHARNTNREDLRRAVFA